MGYLILNLIVALNLDLDEKFKYPKRVRRELNINTQEIPSKYFLN